MSKIKEANLKTVKKWQKEFKAEFEHDIRNSKLCSLRCITCKQWESRIKSSKNFSLKWLSPSATTIIDCKKTCVKFRASGSSEALQKKSKLGSEASKQLLIEKTLIGESLKRMCNSDCKSLNVKF